MLVGDNSLMHPLRILTSLELFLNAQFYSQHHCFSSVLAEHGDFFGKSINNLLPSSVTQECLDTGLTKEDLVKHEALLNLMIRNGHHFFVFWLFHLFYIGICLHIILIVVPKGIDCFLIV